MCLAIDQMMKESRLEGKLEGRLEGRLEGKLEGKLEGGIQMLFELVRKKVITITQASNEANLTEEEFKTKMIEAGYTA